MADFYNYLPLFGGTLGRGYYGIHQANESDKALAELMKEPYAKFQTGEQIYDRAKQKAEGLSEAEKSFVQQNLNRLSTQRYRMATDRNPNLAGVVQAGINYGNVQGELSLAAKDAATRRNSLHSLLGLIGNQSNLQTQDLLNRRYQTESALGAAKQAGITNAGNASKEIKNDITSAFTTLYGGGLLGKGGGGSGGSSTAWVTPQSIEQRGFGGMGASGAAPAWGGNAAPQTGWNNNKTWQDYQANYPNMTWEQYLAM